MNFNQLKSIIMIAEEKNLTHAAKKLFVSQSALSQCVKNVEKEIGARIFDTKSAPIKITYTGEKFLAWAKKSLSSAQDLALEINDIENQKHVRLVIGIVPHRSAYFMPPVIKQFKDRFPDSILQIKEYPLHLLHKMMENGDIDLLIDFSNPNTITYKSILLKQEELVLEVPPDQDVTKGEVDLKEFSEQQFIMLSEDLDLGRLTRDICKSFGFEPKIAVECRTLGSVHALVQEGLGVAFVPELFAKYYSNNAKYVKIKDCNITRDLCAVYNKNKYNPAALKYFINILQDFWQKA